MLFGLVWLDFLMFFALSPVDNTRGHRYIRYIRRKFDIAQQQ